MSVLERILVSLSRDPGASDLVETQAEPPDARPTFASLEKKVPGLAELVRGRRVLDFGCGFGGKARAVVEAGAAEVVGLDTNEKTLATAVQLHGDIDADRLRFVSCLDPASDPGFDVVLSFNAMEHYPEPEAVLAAMAGHLRPDGVVVIAFGPPWLAPYGSHMHFFTSVPWVNLLFPERTVMAVRSRYRSDGARRYEDVESGLNRMTLAKFERLVAGCGLRMRWKRYDAVRGLPVLPAVPLLRELVVNHVACVLDKP